MDKKEQKQVYKVDKKGSLGLLALGYKGLFAWREKIAEPQKKGNDKKKK